MALATGSILGLTALGKLIGGVKLGSAMGAAAKLSAKGALGKLGTKMAGGKLANFGTNAMSMMPQSARELGTRVLPDAMFGTLAGVMTPGDLGDKLTAGGTQFLMETGLGLSAGKLSKNQQLSGLLDMGGSIVGGYSSMPVSDQLLRIKDKIGGGEGMTPYEKLSAQQQMALAQQIEQQVLNAYGISTAGRYVDPTTGMGVS